MNIFGDCGSASEGSLNMDVSENSVFFKSQIIHGLMRVFHDFHHPFFGGPVSPSLRNTHLLVFSLIFAKQTSVGADVLILK